ncbi:ribosomal protein S12 methylthiotransferase accessory factor [Saccharopolyspora lacisalsi]|uniref:Ribosomal protein S12 methylthiotransferase accessory factor n=1 Tax=Halosaccharopolyspora lacisalsi TaxID=1000566 RepID=A0A839E4N0_9PSEU|nr:YcaO-like family protein [Halosaccharopolyspora lacisalsi]MBA8827809.1 ribosomal protein S12 methylthiotransferase accessory factor [Halosaccharopolyspora lacisalsi]
MPITEITTEREVSLSEAAERAHRLLDQRGWQAHYDDLGHGATVTAWRCTLHDAHGHPIPGGTGAGKGHTDAARVGAVFEAIEHYTSRHPELHHADIAPHPAGTVAEALGPDPITAVLAADPEVPVGCVRYHAAEEPQHELLAPAALSVPYYCAEDHADQRRTLGDHADYRVLARYASNSGSAIGTSHNEALLHALNEAIERDALSLLLVRAFLAERAYRPQVLDVDTLPGELVEMTTAVENHLGDSVWLVEITTDIGVPTVLAYTPPSTHHPRHRRGLGTSLSRHHAIYRALGELLQGELVGEVTLTEQLAHLADYHTGLHRCATFDLGAHLAHAETIPYRPTPGHQAPADQVEAVLAHLRAAGYTAYTRTLGQHTLPIVHALVPGLERFMTILQGVLNLPGPRAHHHRNAPGEHLPAQRTSPEPNGS